MVPPYSHRVSRVRRYSGYSWLIFSFVYRALTVFGLLSHTIRLDTFNTVRCPYPECISTFGLACSAFARHYLRNLGWFLFLALLRCFSSGGSPRTAILFTARWQSIALPGCPIRISTDITFAYNSPWLFAVNRVLLRLPVPRHSPCALLSLTFWHCIYLTMLMWSSLFSLKKFVVVMFIFYYPIFIYTRSSQDGRPYISLSLVCLFFVQFSRYDFRW